MVNIHEYSCVKQFDFCAGHRILGHTGKCANLHGHNYRLLVEVKCQTLDQLGMVVDFSDLKEWVKPIVDHIDHGFMVWAADEEAIAALKMVKEQKLISLPFNPTVEHLAAYFFRKVQDAMLLMRDAPYAVNVRGLYLSNVRLWETRSCYADYHAS